MAAAERTLRRWLSAVDVVWEVADARCPYSSRNPRLLRMAGAKPRVLVLARADLADPSRTAAWARALEARGEVVVASGPRGPFDPTAADAGGPAPGAAALLAASRRALRRAGSGAGRGEMRAMVVGIPNIGKSALINRLIGRRRSPVGARPGVTRGPLWLRAGEAVFLDTPGILPPRAGREHLWRLAAIGALAEGQADPVEAAASLGRWLAERAPDRLAARYRLEDVRVPGEVLLEAVGRARGTLAAGGRVDLERAAHILLAEFRRGDLGAVTLEDPPGEPPRGQREEQVGGARQPGEPSR
jgi:ribosome biogenesis GTPase A